MEKLDLITVSDSNYINGYEAYHYYYNIDEKRIENKYDIFSISQFLEQLTDLTDEDKEKCFIDYANITKAFQDIILNL